MTLLKGSVMFKFEERLVVRGVKVSQSVITSDISSTSS